MIRCDVVLVQPPIRDFYLTKKRTIPYGLARIAACLCQAGYSVAIVDALATRRSRPLTWPEPLSDLEPLYGPPDLSPFALFRGFKHFGRSHRYVARQVTSYQPRVVGISSLFSAYADQALACLRAIREQAARTQKELPAIVFGRPPRDDLCGRVARRKSHAGFRDSRRRRTGDGLALQRAFAARGNDRGDRWAVQAGR
jgi:hypothetical protein